MTDHLDRIIARQLAGEATPQEKEVLQTWLNANEKNRDEYNKLMFTYQLSKGQRSGYDRQLLFDKIVSRIATEKEIAHELRNKRNGLLKMSLGIAASILVIIAIGTFYFLNSIDPEASGSGQSVTISKTNPAGQKSKVFLPDGSIVWLNSESSISYESEFNDSTRHLHLTGEAFFEVKKDQNRPFVVYSGTVSTTALGTAFNINAYDENYITVSLTNGKVNVKANNVSSTNQGLIINAGEGVVYNSEKENPINKILIDPSKVMMWRDGLLYLENSTLSETITKLERWYGVKIVIENKPKDIWSANGIFDNEYLDNVLHSLSFSQDFNYEIKGKQVYVTFK